MKLSAPWKSQLVCKHVALQSEVEFRVQKVYLNVPWRLFGTVVWRATGVTAPFNSGGDAQHRLSAIFCCNIISTWRSLSQTVWKKWTLGPIYGIDWDSGSKFQFPWQSAVWKSESRPCHELMHACSACGHSNILYFDLCGHFQCLRGVKEGEKDGLSLCPFSALFTAGKGDSSSHASCYLIKLLKLQCAALPGLSPHASVISTWLTPH